MLELIPKSIFSNSFDFHAADGSIIEIGVSQWRDRAHFTLDGIKYSLYREGEWRGDFVLEREGAVFARAKKRGLLRDTFEIDLAGKPFTLKKKSIIGRRFLVISGEKQVGEVFRKGLWSRRTYLDLPKDWPVALQLFVFWLALIIWIREEAAT
jgi:hypothetical protein